MINLCMFIRLTYTHAYYYLITDRARRVTSTSPVTYLVSYVSDDPGNAAARELLEISDILFVYWQR